MSNRNRTTGVVAGLAMMVIALVVPAAASAHGSVYRDIAKVVPSPPPASPFDWTVLEDQVRYVVTNHGNTYVLRESNGLLDHGMIDYKKAPGAWRSQASVTTAELFNRADSGAQPHSTCTGVAELESEPAITDWQEESSAGKPEPFYRYVPFQKASAGLGDVPADWIGHVATLTQSLPGGPVDLSTVSDDPATAQAQLASLCSGIGGTFVAADTVQTTATALNSETIANATSPLITQIDQLETANAALEADKTALQADKTRLESEKTAAQQRAGQEQTRADQAEAKVKKLEKKVKKLKRKLNRK